MEETIKFEVLDEHNHETVVELMVDTEKDVFSISMKGLKVMSGGWSENLQQVLERSLKIWKVEIDNSEEIKNE